MNVPSSTVLLVDDDSNFLTQFQDYLESRGISTVTAANADHALKILSEKNMAVILADERMPGQKGAELLEEVQKKYPDVVRVLMTGYSDLQSVINAVNRGAIYRYVSKKLVPDEILSVVKQSLEKYHQDKEVLKLCRANRRLLRMLAAEQNLSVVGIFGKEVSQKIEEIVTGISAYLFRNAGQSSRDVSSSDRLKNDFAYLDRALKRIGVLSSLSPEEGEKTASIGDFHRLLESKIESLKIKALEKDICLTLDLQLEKNSAILNISLSSLKRIVREILENAVLFSPPSRCFIEITTLLVMNEEDPHYEICVVNPTVQKSLLNLPSWFAPFYTTLGHIPHSEGTPLPEGDDPKGANPKGASYNLTPYFHYGLGLPLAQWFSARHGGLIELNEENQKIRVKAVFSVLP